MVIVQNPFLRDVGHDIAESLRKKRLQELKESMVASRDDSDVVSVDQSELLVRCPTSYCIHTDVGHQECTRECAGRDERRYCRRFFVLYYTVWVL